VKVVGLLGGTSWESTAVYYRLLNEETRRRLGGFHSARCLVNSVDFAGYEERMRADRWDEIGELLAEEARRLQRGGADVLLLCTGSMHRVAPEIEAAVVIPFIHIADPVGNAATSAGLARLGLLATRYTMEQDFYRGRLRDRFGIDVLIPPEPVLSEVHRVVFEELVLGDVRESSRVTYRAAMHDLAAAGAQGIVLGCTEIPMLVGPADAPVPVFDGTELHAQAAVEFALA
jgi:aspartate racemase